MRQQLSVPLDNVAKIEGKIATLVKKETALRARSEIKKGKRILSAKDQEQFSTIGKEIRFRQRAIKAIEKPYIKDFQGLNKAEGQWLRLQGKETVYKVDVELDQILTFFRLSLVNLYTYLVHEIFGQSKISMINLVLSFLALPAMIEESDERKVIILQYNKKDVAAMKTLKNGLKKLNNLGCRTLNGKLIEFRLDEYNSHLKSTLI